ncbi:hypothetical protein Slin15195_G072030 [Septoria linicola]|uniref:Rhodopsin domain-containing protein n=1 Tax=Septoria linicola TaxID=215465 RepID=A0A9Q9AR40_9PEZI|nr:hypothetical protein Slin14017_G104780 [Septoria linicola]USW53884.1 hypothetical protein Slin15195_G072030 [Septoria linicola]
MPMFDCDSTAKLCYCTETSLTAMIDVCVASNCTYAEQLESQMFRTTACEITPYDQSSAINTLSWTAFSLATLCFLLRLSSCLIAREGLHRSDWTILPCYLCLVGATLCIHLSSNNGLGQDSWYFNVDQISDFLKTFYAFTLLEHTIILLTKISLIFTYLRILPRASLSTAYRSLCWTFALILVLTYLAVQLATILQCTPISSTWDFVRQNQNEAEEAEGKCMDITTLYRALSALNLVYDVVLLFLPIPPLLVAYNRFNTIQKSGVGGMYILGMGVIICSIGRLVPSTGAGETQPTLNLTRTLAQATIWTILQINLGFLVICIPGLNALANILLPQRRLGKSVSFLFDNDDDTSSAAGILPNNKEQNQRRNMGRPTTANTTSSSAYRDFQLQPPPPPRSRDKEEEEQMSSSPALHVGLAEDSVTLQHSIPAVGKPTRDRFVYKDGGGRMHEVEVVDRPEKTQDSDSDF